MMKTVSTSLVPAVLATVLGLFLPTGSVLAAPATAVCAVCGPGGAGPEPVAATVEYRSRTYSFCSPGCRDEFVKDPERWIRAAAQAPGPEGTPQPPAGGEDTHRHGGGSAAPS